MKRQNPIPLICPCVYHSTDLSLKIINFNFSLQMKRTRRVGESIMWLLFVPRTITWCHHIELFCCLVTERNKKIHFANLYLAYYLVWISYLNYKNNFSSKGTYAHTQIYIHTHTYTIHLPIYPLQQPNHPPPTYFIHPSKLRKPFNSPSDILSYQMLFIHSTLIWPLVTGSLAWVAEWVNEWTNEFWWRVDVVVVQRSLCFLRACHKLCWGLWVVCYLVLVKNALTLFEA